MGNYSNNIQVNQTLDDGEGRQLAEENARTDKRRNKINRRYQKITELFKSLPPEEKAGQLKYVLEDIKVLAWEGFDVITKIVETIFTLDAILANVERFVFKEGEKNGDE